MPTKENALGMNLLLLNSSLSITTKRSKDAKALWVIQCQLNVMQMTRWEQWKSSLVLQMGTCWSSCTSSSSAKTSKLHSLHNQLLWISTYRSLRKMLVISCLLQFLTANKDLKNLLRTRHSSRWFQVRLILKGPKRSYLSQRNFLRLSKDPWISCQVKPYLKTMLMPT